MQGVCQAANSYIVVNTYYVLHETFLYITGCWRNLSFALGQVPKVQSRGSNSAVIHPVAMRTASVQSLLLGKARRTAGAAWDTKVMMGVRKYYPKI